VWTWADFAFKIKGSAGARTSSESGQILKTKLMVHYLPFINTSQGRLKEKISENLQVLFLYVDTRKPETFIKIY